MNGMSKKKKKKRSGERHFYFLFSEKTLSRWNIYRVMPQSTAGIPCVIRTNVLSASFVETPSGWFSVFSILLGTLYYLRMCCILVSVRSGAATPSPISCAQLSLPCVRDKRFSWLSTPTSRISHNFKRRRDCPRLTPPRKNSTLAARLKIAQILYNTDKSYYYGGP